MGETRDQMIADLRLCGYADGTRYVYVTYAERFIAHFMRPPAELGTDEIREYLLFLEDLGLAASTRVIHVAAIRFLYRVTLKKPQVVEDIPRPKARAPLPQILSHSEIMRVFDHMTSMRCRVAAMTIYGTGLRVGEVCRLETSDIDSKRMLIRVRMGKGGRDRYVMLPRTLLQTLRAYWMVLRPQGPLLFTCIRDDSRPLPDNTLRMALYRAREDAGVTKPVGPHILRHCFATHMLEMGADIRQIQLLLGHGSMQSTARYTQLSKKAIAAMKSPLDLSREEADELG